MLIHEWKQETVGDNFFGKAPHPVLARLRELEREGWTIFSVCPLDKSSDFKVVYRRERSCDAKDTTR